MHGEVAERPIAGALKAPVGKLTGGSNPSLAAETEMAMSELLLIAIDVWFLLFVSVAAGLWATFWPASWLQSDPFPLRLYRWESLELYRGFWVTTLARRLPEAGSTFGGHSKKRLFGSDASSLNRYLMEVRRGEWVHQISCLAAIPLFFFNPLWQALLFLLATIVVNAGFIVILRYNRIRLLKLQARLL